MLDGTRPHNPDAETITGDSLLGFIYGQSAIHIDRFNPQNGESTLKLRPDYFSPIFTGDGNEPIITSNLYDKYSQIGVSTAKLHITPLHTHDHFKTGRPQVFPGFKQLAAVNMVLAQIIQGHMKEGTYASLQAMQDIRFLLPILVGNEIEIVTSFHRAQQELNEFSASALISVNGAQACVVKNLLYQPAAVPDISLKMYAAEIVTQAAGAKKFHKQGKNEMLPLFRGIASVAYGDVSPVQEQDIVTVVADVFGDKSIQGNGVIRHSGNRIAEIQGINCALMPMKVMERIISQRK